MTPSRTEPYKVDVRLFAAMIAAMLVVLHISSALRAEDNRRCMAERIMNTTYSTFGAPE